MRRSCVRAGALGASSLLVLLLALPVVLMLVIVAGCGGERRSAGSRAAIHGWTAGEGAETAPPSRRIDGADAPPPTVSSRTIRGSRPARGVVRRGPVVDVEFAGAPLREAMRLLAEAAGYDLVIGDDLDGVVDVELHDVRPLDAMGAIAEAHGARVRVEGRLVIVGR